MEAVRFMCYIPPVASKKGVIGIGVPQQPCSESRRTTAVSAAFSLVPPFMAARMGSRKARRFPQGLPGTPTRSSCRPQLALGSAVVANRSPWRPTWHSSSTCLRQLHPPSSTGNDAGVSRAASHPSAKDASSAGAVKTSSALRLSACESHRSTPLTPTFPRRSMRTPAEASSTEQNSDERGALKAGESTP